MTTPLSSANTEAPERGSANWESRFGFLFGIILLLVAGGTATAVGFKVKRAQITRTAELKSTFYELAGNPTKIENSSRRLPLPTGENPHRRLFVSVYQLNEWVRTFGLLRALNELEPQVVLDGLQGLSTIGSTEAFQTTRETWGRLHGDPAAAPALTSPSSPNDPTARRIAKRYDRTFLRDVEAKLYRYLHDHLEEIRKKVA
jgi:hypothetical protein